MRPRKRPPATSRRAPRRVGSSSAKVTVGGLRSNLLVGTSGVTTRVDLAPPAGRPSLRRAPDGTLSLTAPPATRRQLHACVSYTPKPTAAQLRAAPSAFPGSYLPYTEFELPLRVGQCAGRTATGPRGGLPAAGLQLVRAPALGTGGEAGAGRRAVAAAEGSTVGRRILASPYGPMYELARHLAAGAGIQL